MKTKNLFLGMATMAAMAMGITSCSSDDNEGVVDDGRVRFTAGATATASRVSGDNGTIWDGNESIGIFMVNHESPYGIAENAENVEYSTTSTGTSASFTGTAIYYPVNTPEKVDFIAYHPYASLSDNYKYAVDVASQTSQSAIDLMWAKATNDNEGYDKNYSDAVNFTFTHQLAKVVINVTAGDGVTSLSGLQVSVAGMNTKATYDVSIGTLSNAATVAAITPYEVTTASKYEAILLPLTLGADHVVTFTIGNEEYKWTMTNNEVSGGSPITELVAGKKYTFSITLHKEEVTVTGEINAWGTETASGTAN